MATTQIKSYQKNAIPYQWVSGPGNTGGRGAFGLVQKAISQSMREEVAIKTIRSISTTEQRQVIYNEIALLGRCSHPNVL